MESIYNFTQAKLKERLIAAGFPGYTTKQVFGWLYKKNVRCFKQMTNLSAQQRKILVQKFYFPQLKLLKCQCSQDFTEKYLFELEDKMVIESVMIPENNRNTLCLSTQVGCKFKCKFCASGQEGFKRNLTAAEIIGQYLVVSELINPKKITNIVFMGIGEPLDNFENTVDSIKILIDSQGIGMGKGRITISTCGLIPQINKLTDLNLGIKLSISLHSADDNQRSKIMPVNKKYPLAELMKSVKQFSKFNKYPVTFEYVLWESINLTPEEAKRLVKLLSGIKAKVNLIPVNSINFQSTSLETEKINQFQNVLKAKGVLATLRKSRGSDINAACGQLKSIFISD